MNVWAIINVYNNGSYVEEVFMACCSSFENVITWILNNTYAKYEKNTLVQEERSDGLHITVNDQDEYIVYQVRVDGGI